MSLFSLQAFSGDSKFGFILGMSTGSPSISTEVKGNQYIITKNKINDFGFHMGVFGEVAFTTFFIQPEVLLSTLSNRYSIEKAGTTMVSTIKNDQSINAEIPVLMGIKVGPFKIQIGPQARFLLTNASQVFDYTGYESQFNEASFSLLQGLGLSFEKFQCNILYEWGISSITKNISFDNKISYIGLKANQAVFNVGFVF